MRPRSTIEMLTLSPIFPRSIRFAIDEVDIDGDPKLVARHGTSVPVVAVDGKVRFRGVVNPVLLDRLLLAECRG